MKIHHAIEFSNSFPLASITNQVQEKKENTWQVENLFILTILPWLIFFKFSERKVHLVEKMRDLSDFFPSEFQEIM